MANLLLILVGGFLGSSHCVGMCGGFALTIGLGAQTISRNLERQLLYSIGRIFTYGILGSAAGYAGLWFSRRSGLLVNSQALLSLGAGILLIAQGVKSLSAHAGPRLGAPGTVGAKLPSCQANSVLGPLLSSPQRSSIFLAGVLNGLLPCGLVYGYLALASSGSSLPLGFATMVAFGLGTVPMMVASGVGASLLSRPSRRRLMIVAASCVILTGVLAVSRGVTFWRIAGDVSPRCPACAVEGVSSGAAL